MARPSRRRVSAYRRLSPQYKDRLRYAGIGEREYVQGYNLQRLPPLTRERRKGAIARLNAGEGRPEDYGIARRVVASRYTPARVRNQPGVNKVSTAVVALQVSDWNEVTNVSFNPNPGGIWTAEVSYRDGDTQTISVPGDTVQDLRAWLSGSNIDNDIGGSP